MHCHLRALKTYGVAVDRNVIDTRNGRRDALIIIVVMTYACKKLVQGRVVVQGGGRRLRTSTCRRAGVQLVTDDGALGRGYYLAGGMRERQGRQVGGGFFAAPLRPWQGAEQEKLGGRQGLFTGILTAIRVRRQAGVLVRQVLSGFPSAPVPHVRVGSCTERRARSPPRNKYGNQKTKI